jgi:diguanylate cyclase (GGDEF)-like protein
MAKTVRTVDIFGRYGGEEFALLLPDTAIPEAIQVAERLRLRVAEKPFRVGQLDIPVTISLGLAEREKSPTNVKGLLEAADSALFIAKRAGRNKVAILE